MNRDECTTKINLIVQTVSDDATFIERFESFKELKSLLKLRFSLIPKKEIFAQLSNYIYYCGVSLTLKLAESKFEKVKEERAKMFTKAFSEIFNVKPD